MFDKNKPAGTQKVRLADDDIRANNAGLEAAIGQDHDFVTGGGQTGEHKQVKFLAPIATPGNEADKGFVYIKDVGGKAELHFLDEDGNETVLTKAGAAQPFPTGTKMYFYQDVAPTGWTIDGACVDALLAVKGGANAYNVAGGGQAGTWTQPNHTHTGPSHTHTGPSHVHGLSTHYHLMGIGGEAGGTIYAKSTSLYGTSGSYAADRALSISVGAWTPGNPKTSNGLGNTDAGGTGATGAGGTGATGGGATAATYRPLAQVGIIATKD